MFALWKKLWTGVPSSFVATLALAGGFLAFVGWDQSHWWRVKLDYSFGWIVPLFVIFVIYDRWPKILAALAACAAPASPRARHFKLWLLWLLVGGGLLLGVGFFLLGALYRAGAGTSQPGTLAITMGMIGIVLPLLFISAPESPTVAAAGFFADARVQLITHFMFPVFVWLISAPLVSALESQLNLALLRYVVSLVAFIFDLLGLPIEQQGNVLAWPRGHVGVADACSGIRSLTGCLFSGAFLAAVYLDRAWQKISLFVAAVLLAFGANLARSLFLTAWAYAYESRAIEGVVHDLAGYAVLALTIAGLLGLIPLLKRARAPRLRPTACPVDRVSNFG